MRPSIWGKLKAAVQFVAITLAIVRTSSKLGPLYPDQWAMLVAAAFTIGSAVDYLARFAGVFSSTSSAPARTPPAVTSPVLVTGGSGFVGGAIVARLLAEGREVRALARSDRAASALEAAGADTVRGDLDDAASLADAMRGCDLVFHAGGVNAMCLRDPGPMMRTNVEGSANVVRAAAEAGVARVVHTSSAAAIGEAAGTVGREDSPHRG